MPGAVRRLIFTNKASECCVGHYVTGSGVGAKTTSVRRGLRRRASVRYDPLTKRAYNPCNSTAVKRCYFPINLNPNAPQNQIR